MKISGSYKFYPYAEIKVNESVRLAIYDNQKEIFIHFEVIKPFDKYYINYSDLADHFDLKYKYQILDDDNKWKDHHVGYRALIPERVDETGLKYAFYPSRNTTKHLIVCFQAIQTTPSYNYIRTLNNVNAHRLYIKDDYGLDEKTHSSYYLNERNQIKVDTLVQLLIDNYVNHLGISKENIIFIGSSKGGFAGLYHGYKYGVGYIVVGGPQTMLGNYLCINSEESIRPAIFKSIFGDPTAKEYANSLIYEELKKSTHPFPKTYIHIGRGEPHYEQHVLPFMEWAEEMCIPNINIDIEDYDDHEELATYYPAFLKRIIPKIINV